MFLYRYNLTGIKDKDHNIIELDGLVGSGDIPPPQQFLILQMIQLSFRQISFVAETPLKGSKRYESTWVLPGAVSFWGAV